MIVPFGSVVDTGALAQVVAVSLVAGIGVTLAFSIAIRGVVGFAESQRDERRVAAGAFALLVLVALGSCAAAIVKGIEILASK